MNIFTRLGAMLVALMMVFSLSVGTAGTANAIEPRKGKVTVIGALPEGCKPHITQPTENKRRDNGTFTVSVSCVGNDQVRSVSVVSGKSRRCLLPFTGNFTGCPVRQWSMWRQAKIVDILVPKNTRRSQQKLAVVYEFKTAVTTYQYQVAGHVEVHLKNGTTVRTKQPVTAKGGITNNPASLRD